MEKEEAACNRRGWPGIKKRRGRCRFPCRRIPESNLNGTDSHRRIRSAIFCAVEMRAARSGRETGERNGNETPQAREQKLRGMAGRSFKIFYRRSLSERISRGLTSICFRGSSGRDGKRSGSIPAGTAAPLAGCRRNSIA